MFRSEWFKNHAYTLIEDAIKESNDTAHQTYTQYNRLDVEYFIQRIIHWSGELVTYQQNTNSSLARVTEARAF